jgi:hypothetical protein
MTLFCLPPAGLLVLPKRPPFTFMSFVF